VAAFVNQQFIAGDAVQPNGHLIALSTRAGEDRSFAAEHVGHHALKSVDGGIFAHDVITDFCSKHRLTHGGSGPSDSVASQINQPHVSTFQQNKKSSLSHAS
jgi:hypothetical protein